MSGWDGSTDVYDDPEEKRVIFAALDSFYQYSKTAHYNTTHTRRQNFYALPRAQWELLAAPPISYLDTLSMVDDAIDKNADLAMDILNHGLEAFGLESAPEAKSAQDWHGAATTNDLEKARSTIRQFYRDWSSEGSVERSKCYDPVISALVQMRSESEGSSLNVLVPGAGLGRLVFELTLRGFNVEGNEISYHQLLASSYILNACPKANLHTLYPWVHGFSNHQSRTNQLQSVQIPDVHVITAIEGARAQQEAGEMNMAAADFISLYGDEVHEEAYHAVASVFFLDTAPNILRYLEVIKNCLKPGGLLINFGPLLWHFENVVRHGEGKSSQDQHQHSGGTTHSHNHSRSNSTQAVKENGIMDPGSFELTDEEVLQLVEKVGFEIVDRQFGIDAPYIQDPRSMMQHVYKASFWVARKL